MDNGYLVPANTKKATLVAGFLRPTPDLVIASVGTVVSFIGLISTSTLGLVATIISLIPLLVCWMLVLPIPNYHNTLCVIQSILDYYQRRKKYIWKGWCTRYEYEKDNRK